MENHEAFLQAFNLGRIGATIVETPDGGRAALVPQGTTRIDMPPLEPKLTRIRQQVALHDADSFVDYVNRYKSEKTRLFAEAGFLAGGPAHITAVMDYHEPASPEYAAHVARFVPRYSTQWARWQAVCGPQMKQAEFAELIEECRADISEPSAAQLLDIVRTFKASKKTEFDSLTYTSNGDAVLCFDERTEQKGKSGPLPEQMKLGIPVYFRGTVYAVPLFIRFRLGSGAVAFQLKLDRADVIEDEAFAEITKSVGTAVGIEPYIGRMAGR